MTQWSVRTTRRAWWATLFIPGLLTLASRDSFATDTAYHSAQWFAVEFKMGPYAPNIDSEFDGKEPFATMFGSGTGLMFGGEFDVQLWRGFGSIGLGLFGSFYSKSGATCLDDSQGGEPASCDQLLEDDRTSLTLVPLSVLAIYRFDVLAERWGVPLVPYAKVGLNYTLWWIRRSDGSVSEIDGHRGRGGNLGVQVNVGGALQLDVFDPRAARAMDAEYGVNHTYAFVELLHLYTAGYLDIGATTVMGGLALEF